MAFLNPLMLFGIAGISVPILIHLLNRRKFERVRWAAMRFLKAAVERNRRRMRVEDLLLLILRCAVVALLALALARPAIQGAAAGLLGQNKVVGVIVLDNSYSMSATDGVSSRFEKAKAAAEQVIDALPAGSSLAVFLASDVVEGVIPEPTLDLNLARKTLREAKLSDRSSDLFPAVRDAINLLESRPGLRKEAYFITDGQALAWRQVEPIQKLLSDKRESVHGTFIFTGAAGAEDRNLAVTGLRLAAGLAPVDRALRFDVQVSNFGATEQRGVRVSLAMNNEPASDETLIDVIPPGESRSVSMFAKLRGMGYHTVRATIPADHLPADDSRTLAVRATTRVNVLLVDGEAGREPRDGETFFLRHALVPVPAAEAYDYFIRTDTISPAELPTTKLDDYDAVFLCNVNDFSDRVLEQFAAYLRRGGGLVVLPGGNTRAEFYNDKMLGQYRFLPAALGPAVGDAQSETPHTSFQSEGFEHEISELWNAKSAGDVTAARFYREFELTPDGSTVATQPAGPARVVMRYANGRPAIMERAWGQGRVVLFSSTADTAWNDLPVRPGIFIPLMHRTLGAIVARQDESLNVRVGQRFTYRATPDLLGRDAIIQKPSTDDPELARTTRKLELRGEDVVLYYEDTGRAGTYEVSIAGDSPMEIRFAAQADPAESDLKMVAPEIKTAIGGSAQIIDWQPGVSLEGDFHTRRSGTEVWVTVAMLALCVAVAEMFLAQWFSLPK